jgi:hypothetical protein
VSSLFVVVFRLLKKVIREDYCHLTHFILVVVFLYKCIIIHWHFCFSVHIVVVFRLLQKVIREDYCYLTHFIFVVVFLIAIKFMSVDLLTGFTIPFLNSDYAFALLRTFMWLMWPKSLFESILRASSSTLKRWWVGGLGEECHLLSGGGCVHCHLVRDGVASLLIFSQHDNFFHLWPREEEEALEPFERPLH